MGLTKEEYLLKQKFEAIACGRQCDSCGKHDTEVDPCEPDETILWGRFVNDARMQLEVRLKKDGATCYYCIRIWDVCYKLKYPALGEWKKAKIKDSRELRLSYRPEINS